MWGSAPPRPARSANQVTISSSSSVRIRSVFSARSATVSPSPGRRSSGRWYVELHCHSAYSFLDGASQPEELAARAAELGYEALALTDHDGVYGSLEFAHAAKAFGVRPITAPR